MYPDPLFLVLLSSGSFILCFIHSPDIDQPPHRVPA
ncbi:unnamed protein product [Rhodiola kirilowii]